ncbi:NUC185 domain-containing protein [Cladochytrium replicatum]|nr:NUC185 domain-containing protein [Cladochytrium replicatum]
MLSQSSFPSYAMKFSFCPIFNCGYFWWISSEVNHVPILMGDPNAFLTAIQDLLEVCKNHVGPGLIEEFDWSNLRDIVTHEEKQLAKKVRDLSNLDQNLHLLPDYHRRVEVLKVLSFIEEDETVKIKVASLVRFFVLAADELILSELILDNILRDYEPAEIVALLSAFVFQEKRASEPFLTLRLKQGIETRKEIAVRVAEVQRQCGLPVAVDEVRTAFNEITELTDVLEGSIVRCIVRLDETCRDVRNAARIIGDTSLYHKMEEASEAIKRDIVFAASLYHSI